MPCHCLSAGDNCLLVLAQLSRDGRKTFAHKGSTYCLLTFRNVLVLFRLTLHLRIVNYAKPCFCVAKLFTMFKALVSLSVDATRCSKDCVNGKPKQITNSSQLP